MRKVYEVTISKNSCFAITEDISVLEHAIWRERRIPHVLAIYDGSSKIFSVCNIHIKQKKRFKSCKT